MGELRRRAAFSARVTWPSARHINQHWCPATAAPYHRHRCRHTRTHTRTHTHAHTRTHAHTHTRAPQLPGAPPLPQHGDEVHAQRVIVAHRMAPAPSATCGGEVHICCDTPPVRHACLSSAGIRAWAMKSNPCALPSSAVLSPLAPNGSGFHPTRGRREAPTLVRSHSCLARRAVGARSARGRRTVSTRSARGQHTVITQPARTFQVVANSSAVMSRLPMNQSSTWLTVRGPACSHGGKKKKKRHASIAHHELNAGRHCTAFVPPLPPLCTAFVPPNQCHGCHGMAV